MTADERAWLQGVIVRSSPTTLGAAARRPDTGPRLSGVRLLPVIQVLSEQTLRRPHSRSSAKGSYRPASLWMSDAGTARIA